MPARLVSFVQTPLLFRLALVFAVVASTLFAGRAQAQTIGIVNEASPPRTDTQDKQVAKRPQQFTPEAVSLQDCVNDQRILYSLQLAGYQANAQIQIWASGGGQDCKPSTSRQGLAPYCWRLGPDVSLQPNPAITIPVRKIMSGISPFTPGQPDDSINVCGKVDLATVNVHFLYFAPGNTTDATVAKTVTVTVDTVGPKPPSGLRALAGDGRIKVEWNSISGGSSDAGGTTAGGSTSGSGLTELTGVKVYCDTTSGGTEASDASAEPVAPVCTDVPNDGGVDEAGNAIDAGFTTVCEDGGSSPDTPGPTCSSANFTGDGGTVLPTDAFNTRFQCGSFAGNIGSGVTAESVGGAPLVNGTQYAVAVAATDKYGNVGALSDVVCMTPRPTRDFWADYKGAGGQAGGCATTGEDFPLGSAVALGVAAATVLGVKRRRDRARGQR